jgi:predicted signal transduction protein with EAL and GGDEF domain
MDIVRQATGRISFEVTKTAMINDPERAMANLRLWSDAGIEIAIDEYGSGLSSLGLSQNNAQ